MFGKLFSRRNFLASSPVALAAAPLVVDKAVEAMRQQGASGLVGGSVGQRTTGLLNKVSDSAGTDAQSVASMIAEKTALNRVFAHPDMRAIDDAIDAACMNQNIAEMWRDRHGGFDPDLLAMRSVSPAARCRIQMRRNVARQEEINRLEREKSSIKERVIDLLGVRGLLQIHGGPSKAPGGALQAAMDIARRA